LTVYHKRPERKENEHWCSNPSKIAGSRFALFGGEIGKVRNYLVVIVGTGDVGTRLASRQNTTPNKGKY
jgi:hypothetical protein